MNWVSHWQSLLRLPEETPEAVVAVLALVVIYIFVVLPSSALMAFVERKLGADFQARVGPNRAGPAGILQPIADFLKLLQKQTPEQKSWRERFWLNAHSMALYSTVAVLPLGSTMLMVNTDMSAFLPFWAALVLALGTMLLGLNQETIPGWFGGIRVAAQALAGAFPALIAILCAGMRAGGFQWTAFTETQRSMPWQWTWVSNPFELLAFVVFMVSGMVLLCVPPLDGGLSISDIHGGVSSQLNGQRLGLFRLGRFYGFFLWSVIAAVLFLGGWNLPSYLHSLDQSASGLVLLQLLELAVVLAKAFGLMILVTWVARVNPRIRADQITDFTWKVLSPASLLALAGSAAWMSWRTLL